MIKVLLVCTVIITFQYAVCIDNSETKLDTLKDDTIDMIEDNETTIKKEVKNYGDALKEKKKAMKKLLKTMRKIEALMKKNQQERRKIIKHWDDMSKSHIISN